MTVVKLKPIDTGQEEVVLTPHQIRTINGLFAKNPDSSKAVITQDDTSTKVVLSGYKYTGTSSKFFEVETYL